MSKEELKPTNVKDDKRVPVIHGENYFVPVDKVPEGEFKSHSKFVAGHSESGHNHVFVSDRPFEVMESSDKHDLFVRLFQPTELVHEKTFDIHETQILAPGDYAVYYKTEYDPVTEQRRRVYD